MENQNTKKVLSECSNTQRNLYVGCGNSIDSMKKMDYLITRGSSDAPAANIISQSLNSVGSTLINNHSSTMNDTNDLTTARIKSEVKRNAEVANSQVKPSRDFSDSTAADYGITPEFFTKQCKEESKNILKKFKRRSTIGARGSPENESLIRYIAQQRRMKMQGTLSQSSPFQHQNTLLNDKIAAFQSSFKALEETEEKAIHIHTTSNTRLHEQSKLGQAWSLEDKNNAFEENLNNKFMNGDGISADIQMHSTRFPSWEPFLSGTNVVSKAILVSPANAVESTSVSLVATPSMGISKSERGAQSTNKELSRNDTSQHSCKKVRFSEKQSLEIFDESEPPITLVEKGRLFSNSLRSVLKKTPVKISPEGLKDLQGSSEEVAAPIFPGTSDLEETKNNPPDHQAPLIRTTRTSAKRKCVVKAEEKNRATKIEAENQPGKFQKAKTSTKSKKAPAAQQGKKRRKGKKKKEQKVFYGQRETVSKKPLLSPILEATEDASFFSSYPNIETLKASTSDDSLSDLHAKFINEIAEDKKSPPHAIKEDSHCQHSSLDLQEEDSISSSFLQLQDLALNNRKQLLPGYLPEKNSPGKLKSSLNGNEQVVGSDCLSSGAEVQLEELLNMCGTSKNIKAKETSFFTVDFATELMNESNQVNFERIPRNSRRLTGNFLNTESKSPGNSAGVPGGNLGGLPPCSWTADDTALLNHLCSIEENRSVTKKVRRSMRGRKDGESEGLAWIQIPADDFLGQVPLESACKVQKRLSSSGPQESTQAVISPYGSRRRRRRSLCVSGAEKDQSVAFHIQRNRRASLGYKSDRCHRNEKVLEESTYPLN